MAEVTIKIPTQLRSATGGQGTLKVEGTTVGTALESLFTEHPELRSSLTDADGDLRRFVNVYLDGEDIRFGDGLGTAVADRQELQILPAVAGGR
jgi:molybdopterin synthase sulfur carrier subunit